MIQLYEKTPANTVVVDHGADRSDHNRIVFTWHGCAHYHIRYKDKTIVIDPLYHRPRGDTPHLGLSRDDIDHIDYLLLTHAHMDHSWDFPYLASRYRPQAYGPGKYLADVLKKGRRRGLGFNQSRLHALEKVKGQRFWIDDIEVTPYQIGKVSGRPIRSGGGSRPSLR
jgi:mRNA degradation ribonuclease J1/J2